ncbi:hypothetical protein CVT26_005172 [Gymnopilus dilepis]|uniref:Uncharacterized protein n=1 Tax=Gymnopilus dilepis TaxID=231916 RepID=A0A409WWQ5_9AGAR|nr:hypothetical protein CVT26_005172 [Gymnopilus dilepis]
MNQEDDDVAARRAISPFISDVICRTDVLQRGHEWWLRVLEHSRPEYHRLFAQFAAYEQCLFGITTGTVKHGLMRELLGVNLVSAVTPGSATCLAKSNNAKRNWTAAQYGSLCSLFTLYWLADLLVFMAGEGHRLSAGRVINRTQKARGLMGYNILNNWPTYLLRFNDVVLRDSSDLLSPYTAVGSVCHKLLQFLTSNACKSAQYHVLSNITVAALHLAFLRDYAFPRGTLPDLPDQISEAIIVDASPELRFFLAELANVAFLFATTRNRTAKGGQSLASFRAPLQLALAITPLYLLSDTVLCKKSWNRRAILKLAFGLGNDKPVALIQAEKVLWDVLFLLANGALQPADVLKKLKSDLPWDSIKSTQMKGELSWFCFIRESIVDSLGDDAPSSCVTSENTGDLATPQSVSLSALPSESSSPSVETAEPIYASSQWKHLSPIPSETKEIEETGCTRLSGEEPSSRTTLNSNSLKNSVMDVEKSPLRIASVASSAYGIADAVDASISDSANEREAVSFVFSSSGDANEHDISEGISDEDWIVDDDDYSASEDDSGRRSLNDSPMIHAEHSPLFLPGSPHESDAEHFQISPNLFLVDSGGACPSSALGSDVEFISESAHREVIHAHLSSFLDPFDGVRGVVGNIFSRMQIQSQELYKLFNANGRAFHLRPESHVSGLVKPLNFHVDACLPQDQDSLSRIKHVLHGVESGYCNDKAMHLSDPSRSAIAVYSFADFNHLADKQFQDLLAGRVVVVTGAQVSPYTFDEAGFSALYPLQNRVVIKDYSCRLSTDDSRVYSDGALSTFTPSVPVEERERLNGLQGQHEDTHSMYLGFLKDVLCESKESQGRMLEVAHIPLPHKDATSTIHCSTDRRAWYRTLGILRPPAPKEYPSSELHWAAISTRDTASLFRLPPHGMNLFSSVRCGRQAWFFPRKSSDVANEAQHTIAALAAVDDSSVEAVVLELGDLIVMSSFIRGDQPFSTYTMEPAIVQGEYFYSTPLMGATAKGIYESFKSGVSVPDLSTMGSHDLRRRILDFYRLSFLEHKSAECDASFSDLPDIHTCSGLLTLLDICNLHVLANIVDYRTYQLDSVHQPPPLLNRGVRLFLTSFRSLDRITKNERLSMVYARGVALELLDWIRDLCHISSRDSGIFPDFPTSYLIAQLSTIVQDAENDSFIADSPAFRETLRREVVNVLSCDEALSINWQRRTDPILLDFKTLNFERDCTVCWAQGPVKPLDYAKLLRRGMTAFDSECLWSNESRTQNRDLAMDDRVFSGDDVSHSHKRRRV